MRFDPGAQGRRRRDEDRAFLTDRRTETPSRLFVALVHYPVYNRQKKIVATAITNLDIHDIARASKTYGIEGLLIVNPLERQHWLLDRIVMHWKEGHGAKANPIRAEALCLVHPMKRLEEALEWVESRCGASPITIATSAKSWPQAVSYADLRGRLRIGGDSPFVLLFGTGWGLTNEIVQEADYVLQPVLDGASYNHLSVRSAASIIMDRLLGDREAD